MWILNKLLYHTIWWPYYGPYHILPYAYFNVKYDHKTKSNNFWFIEIWRTDLILRIPLERYTSCSNSRFTIFSYPPRVAIVSAFTPSRLQIDGSAPFWSNSFTHSKWPSRQACINGDHPYLFKASKYSGYCRISSLAMKCSKKRLNHIQPQDQFNHSTVVLDMLFCMATL